MLNPALKTHRKKKHWKTFTAHAKAAGIGRRSFEGMGGMVAVDAAEIPGVTVEIAPGSLILPAAKDTMPLSDLLNDCPIRIHDRTGSFLLPSVLGGFRVPPTVFEPFVLQYSIVCLVFVWTSRQQSASCGRTLYLPCGTSPFPLTADLDSA